MEYNNLQLPEHVQPQRRVARVVFKANQFLRDAHTMLILPKRASAFGQWGGCNFAITLLLCSLIEGISKRLSPIDPPGQVDEQNADRERFRQLIVSDMPWAKRGAKWMDKSDAGLKLYKLFRNDLAHGMALNDEGIIGNTGGLSDSDYLGVDELDAWPSGIKIIESDPPDDAGNRRVGAIKVVNAGLYWHTKRMIENVIANRDMDLAESRMKAAGVSPLPLEH